MKRNHRSAFNALKKLGAPVFETYDSGNPVECGFKISAEDNYPETWADYWGEYGGYSSYINPKIEKILSKYHLFAEWENPGVLSVWDI